MSTSDTVEISYGGVKVLISCDRSDEEFEWDWGYYEVTLEDANLSARAAVAELERFTSARYFQDLQEYWRGWPGEKAWESIEVHLSLSATIDRSGHITMTVTLRNDPGPHGWTAIVRLTIGAGAQLSRIVQDVTALLS